MRKLVKAAAAATVFLACIPSAHAADMSMPPLYQPQSEPMVEFGSGWYLRGDVGYSTMATPGYAYSSTDPITLLSTPPSEMLTDQLGHAGLFNSSVGFGYAFNKWFRSDLTFDWRQAHSGSSSQSFTPYIDEDATSSYYGEQVGGCPFSSTTETACYKVDKTQIQSWSILANVYGDLGTWFGLTPYLGGGVGVTNLHATSGERFYFGNGEPYSSQGYNNTWCPSSTSGSTCYFVGYTGPKATDIIRDNFSWALMAGVAYDIAPHLKLDISYRYLNMGTLPLANASGDIVHRTIDTQDVRAGLRWTPDL